MTLHCPSERGFILSIESSVVDEAKTNGHNICVRIDAMATHICETRRIIMELQRLAEAMSVCAIGETPANGQRANVACL